MEKPPQNQLSVTPATPTASPTTGATKPILKAGANGLLPSLNSIPSLSLPSRFGVDLVAAGTASLLVSPIICIIDKGIIENASGKRKLVESMRYTFGELVRRPHRFVAGRPFRLIYVSLLSFSRKVLGWC